MPGLADIIANGAEGAVNPNFGAQLHQQKFEASQQLQRLQHMHRQELAQNARENAEYYGGVGSPTGRQLHTLSQELLSYPNDATLEANLAKAQARYSQLVAAGDKELAQSHDGNRGIAPVASAPAQPPNVSNSNPFAKLMGPGAVEASPLPGALPASNPLTSPASAQGGAQPVGGPFPGPVASAAPGPVASDALAPVPAASPAPIAPVAGALPNFQGDIDEFNSTGYMSPAIRAMLPGNAALSLGRQKLQAIQPILSEMTGMTDENGIPDISKLMRAEAELSALGVQGANMAPMLLQMLAPQSETGTQTWGSLRPEAKALYAATHPGEDISQIDPNTPVREQVNKFTRKPVGVQIQSVPLQMKQFAEGPFNLNTRTGRYEPAVGPNGQSLTPIAMVPHEGFMSIQQADGSISLVPVETGKKQISAGRAFPTPNSVANAQPDVAAAIAAAQSHGTVPPVASPNAPVPPVKAPPASPTSSGTNGRIGRAIPVGGRNLPPQDVMQMKNAVEVGAHQLWGDPDNPSLRPLVSYASLADDPRARERLGSAIKLVLDNGGADAASHVGASIGPVSVNAGGIGEWFTNELGIPQATAAQRAKILSNATAKLTPEERAYFNSLMNAIPTITGLRRLTGAGAFRWSQQGLERELPMIGLAGTNSATDFRNKMIALGDEPLTAIKNLQRTNPTAIDPRLVDMIRSGGIQGQSNQVLPMGVPKVGDTFGGGRVLHVEQVH